MLYEVITLASLYNKKTGIFVCGDDQQISYASHVITSYSIHYTKLYDFVSMHPFNSIQVKDTTTFPMLKNMCMVQFNTR